MKKYIITGAEQVTPLKLDIEQAKISSECLGGDDMHVSDGYHTMDELYEHRIQLFLTLCHQIHRLSEFTDYFKEDRHNLRVWRSKNHSDGKSAFGGTWFVLGIGKDAGKQITYHLPIKLWEETDFAETLEVAPEWDGHTSNDVLNRLKNL